MAKLTYKKGKIQVVNADKEEWNLKVYGDEFQLDKYYGYGNDEVSIIVNDSSDDPSVKSGRVRVIYNGVLRNDYDELTITPQYFKVFSNFFEEGTNTILLNANQKEAFITVSSSSEWAIVKKDIDANGSDVYQTSNLNARKLSDTDLVISLGINPKTTNQSIKLKNFEMDKVITITISISTECNIFATYINNNCDIVKIAPSVDKPINDNGIEILIY